MASIIIDQANIDRKARLASLRWIVNHLAANRVMFAIMILGTLMVNGLRATIPFLIGMYIDLAIIPKKYDLVITFALIILAIGLVRVGLAFLTVYASNKLSWGAIKDIRIEFFEKIQRKPLNFHNRVQSGDLMALATNDMSQLGYMINPGIRLVSEAFISLAFVMILAFTIELRLALVLVPFFIVYLWSILRYNKAMTPIARSFMSKWAGISRSAQDSITGVRVVRAFNAEEHEIEKFNVIIEEFRDIWDDRQMKVARYWPLLVLNVTIGIMFLYCVSLLNAGVIQLGDLIAVNGMLLTLEGPTFIISFAVNMFQGGLSAGERIFHALEVESPEDLLEESKPDLSKDIEGKIEFQGVNFSYQGSDTLILKDINLTIAPGETVCLVGPTGSGKTTLTKLILRFFQFEGNILIDDNNIEMVNLRSLRHRIGRVEQDVFLFASTIKENLTFGLPNDHQPTDEEIQEAAKIAQAHGFISQLKNGYDTVVGERGITLSGGQRQRIAIARALLVNPRILILDDSTSAIDSKTEDEISKAIDKVSKNRTTIMITHRLQAIRSADKIVVMKNGTIAAMGVHKELIKTSEDYRRIFRRHIELPELVQVAEGD